MLGTSSVPGKFTYLLKSERLIEVPRIPTFEGKKQIKSKNKQKSIRPSAPAAWCFAVDTLKKIESVQNIRCFG